MAVLVLFSCFGGGVEKRGSVKGYRNGAVITEGGSFRVGPLPETWRRKSFSYRAVLFEQSASGRTISISTFCKGSFDDAPLKILTNQLFYNITAQRRRFQKILNLDGREALRTAVAGKVDGAEIVLDTVVLKMNECVFDFVYVSKPESYPGGVSDFEGFYGGFKYIAGPF
ncbi:MAG: hypothetical protein HYU99_02025 [Deltaproteobacteria bacterium]|nr:hypothetical protein [Deltaproteobacteria bacterium]